jgi:hypothetical protein
MFQDATPFGGAPARKAAFWRVQPAVEVALEAQPAAGTVTGPREVDEFFGRPH